MSPFRFIKCIIEDSSLEVFGDGNQQRDFTCVDDIARGAVKVLKPLDYEIINLGSNKPYGFNESIKLMEKYIGREDKCNYKEFHKADMRATWANIDKAKKLLKWQPIISLEEGIKRTVRWTKDNWEWVKDIKIK